MEDYAVKKGLPKNTKSVCPECGMVLVAELRDEGGKVYMDKTCPKHGRYHDVYWSDTELFIRAEKFAHDGIGLINPADKNMKAGEKVYIYIGDEKVELLTCSALANVDLTNRCNMNCPICFANANQQGYVYEPDYEAIVKMLDALRAEEPIKCTAVQFSGGEPTIHPDFIRIIKAAKERNFAQVQAATNGIVFAKNYELLKDASEAGLNTIYLSFDGVSDDVYLQARDRKMFKVKKDVIENCRKLKAEVGKCPSIVLVPTIVRGMNDHQIGDMVKFSFDNSDVVRGINFQPVAFTGRITKEDLEKGRFTLPDLVREFEKQTGYTTNDDWYPVPVVAPISDFASVLLGQKKVTFTTHPHCGIATYVFMDENGKVTPFPRFIDVTKFTEGLKELSKKVEKGGSKSMHKLRLVLLLNRCVKKEHLPGGVSKRKFAKMMSSVMSKRSKTALASFSWKVMFFGGMHFQDMHNYDVERVRRCGVHYMTPDCRIIPFCAYNGGPEYRKEVEDKFSIPLAEWKAKNKKGAAELEAAMVVPEDQRPD
jgi:uncharacterized radical SAM superfamily Fe-S cluster-containing enzyme